MIDEQRLRELLEAAAAEAPVPAPDASALIEALAGASPQPRRAPSRRRWTLAVPALGVVLALVVGAGVMLDSGRDAGRKLAGTTGATVSRDLVAGGAGTALPALTDTAKIVKTGTVDLEVRKDRFGVTVERLGALAAGVNGYIAKRETSETTSAPHGTVTMRVPVDAFDGAITAIRRMGAVRSVSSEAQDATADYTDRETRLKALTAERDQLLTILTGARTIPEILAVRDRSTQVQVEIERLQGQQRLLDDRATFATLTVTVAEPGSGGLEALDERSGLSRAWHDAVDGFVGGVEAILAASGTIVLVLMCAIALAFAGRAGVRLARRRLV